MNRLLVCMLVIASVGCQQNKQQPLRMLAVNEAIVPEHLRTPVVNYVPINDSKDEPYKLHLKIDALENNLYDLVVRVNLKKGCYYVSPNSKRDFTGVFKLILKESDQLQKTAQLTETPRSVEEYDPHPYVDGYVNWVRQTTTYNQQLKLKGEDNFKVSGMIQFTIEPRCSLEQIPFIISYENGKMTVEIDHC